MADTPLEDIPGHADAGSDGSDVSSPENVVRDKFGFEVVDPEAAEKWQKQYQMGAGDRQFQWTEFLGKIGGLEKISHLPRTHSKLKKLCRLGVPHEFRANVWFMTCGAHELLLLNGGYYQKILDTHSLVPSAVAEQIEMDIPRTFPGHPSFASDEVHGKMRRILTAFSWRNPSLGYCQSMNFIVAMLLLFFEEERAFWMLCRLIEDVLPYDYYTKNMCEARVDQLVLKDLFAVKSKKLHAHMVSHHILVEMVTLPWFLTAMVSQVPTETALRVWDVLFNEGIKTVFRSALALLKVHEAELLSISDPVGLMSSLQRLTAVTYDCDEVMHIAFHKLGSFSMSKVVKLRQRHRATVKAQIDAIAVARMAREKKQEGESDRKYSLVSDGGSVRLEMTSKSRYRDQDQDQDQEGKEDGEKEKEKEEEDKGKGEEEGEEDEDESECEVAADSRGGFESEPEARMSASASEIGQPEPPNKILVGGRRAQPPEQDHITIFS